MTPPVNETPVNPLPPVVVAMFLVMAGIEGTLSLGERGLIGGPGAVGWRNGLIETYGFSGQVFDWMMAQGVWPLEHLVRFFAYPFLHANFTHGLLAMVIMLAMGKIVGEALGSLAVVAIFFVTAPLGALAFGLLSDDPWLVGAFPPVYGLIGGFTYLLWVRLGRAGGGQYRAFQLIGMLMAIQLVFGVLFGGGSDWIADLTGFVTGFGLSIVFAPGGWSRLKEALRQR